MKALMTNADQLNLQESDLRIRLEEDLLTAKTTKVVAAYREIGKAKKAKCAYFDLMPYHPLPNTAKYDQESRKYD
jgi:hypothetical protein